MRVNANVEELFRTDYSKLVRALAVAYGPDPAADAVQEAFIAADRNWWRIRRYDEPSAWVRKVALNNLRNQHRNERRRRQILRAIPSPTQTADTEARMDLRRAIDGLPERMRLAICLHYLADLSIAQVADLLDCTSGTIKSNLHDARTRLRTNLSEVQNG